MYIRPINCNNNCLYFIEISRLAKMVSSNCRRREVPNCNLEVPNLINLVDKDGISVFECQSFEIIREIKWK